MERRKTWIQVEMLTEASISTACKIMDMGTWEDGTSHPRARWAASLAFASLYSFSTFFLFDDHGGTLLWFVR
jgi:hypothetical protein